MRALAIGVVLVVAGRADAKPLAQLTADIDGDGADEQLELTADGVLHVRGKPSLDTKLAADLTNGSIAISQWGGKPLVVVDITLRSGPSEAIVLAAQTKRLIELARVPVGNTLDRDFSVEVDATADGVIRYQTRPGVRRCDGKHTYLFPELFIADTKTFRRVTPPVGVDASAPTLQAHADTTPAVIPLVFQARAASTQGGAADAGGLTIPSELDDGKPETAWREDLGSDGRGQFFTFEPRVPTARASQIRIVPRSSATLRDANRPHRLGVVTKGNAWWIELPDALRDPLGTAYVVDLPGQIDGCVTVVLDTMYRGGPGNVTMIAELEVFADGERTGGGEALLAQAVAAGTDEQAAGAALARRGATAVAAIEAALAKADPASRRRLVRALLRINDAAAGPVLARAATAGWVTGNDLVAVIEALGARRAVAELRELAGRKDLDLRARIAAVTALRGPGAAAVAALVELAGTGPRDFRRAVIDALAGAPADLLVPAAQAAATPAAAGDLWRGLVQGARADAKQRPAALAALAAALPTATDYERRYRIVEGLATLGDAPTLQALATTLRGLPAGAEATALRTVAARAISSAPRADATELVLELVADRDAGVRLTALAALSGAKSDASGPWHTANGPDGIDRVIIDALGGDRWPEVRQRAAEALATRCERPGPAKALESSVARDRDVGVAGAALAALVECRAPGVADLLARTWDDPKAAVALRARAVDLAVALGDRALAAKLIAKLASWRGGALSNAGALELARHAAPAIGRLAPPGAAPALLDALEDSAYPEIVAAAAAGLGLLGPACPPAAKAKLKLLAKSDEQSVSIAASRAAAQCGR